MGGPASAFGRGRLALLATGYNLLYTFPAVAETTAEPFTQELAVNRDEVEDARIYTVVVNEEEQYSVWPADRDLPAGWREAGKTGSKQDCLSYINEVWSDMRPASLRRPPNEDGA